MLFIITACQNDELKEPKSSIEISKTTLKINESLDIRFIGDAEQVVIFTGDSTHRYELRDHSNTGFVVNKNIFSYSYSIPGIYKIVCIASRYNDMATNVLRDTSSVVVNVVDDATNILRLSCPKIIYDEVFAEQYDNDWLVKLPRKLKYNAITPSISLLQRLKFYMESDSTKIFINGVSYSSTTQYNLQNEQKIVVRSNFGTERAYTLYTLYYPELSNFSINGVSGTLIRNPFDYSQFEIEVTLPLNTDASAVAPSFTTTSPNEKVYIGTTEQISGTSIVNFSIPAVYNIEATVVNRPDLKINSIVKVTVLYK